MKKTLLLIVWTVIFAWCGNSSYEVKTISFDKYNMEIDTAYEEQETQESYNTKLWSRQILLFEDHKTNTWFNNNIIITKVAISENATDIADITKIALESITETFGSYQKLSLKQNNISCGENSLPWFIHSYQVSQWILNKDWTYYLSQIYFVDKATMYIVSWISSQSDEQTKFSNYFKSLKCK